MHVVPVTGFKISKGEACRKTVMEKARVTSFSLAVYSIQICIMLRISVTKYHQIFLLLQTVLVGHTLLYLVKTILLTIKPTMETEIYYTNQFMIQCELVNDFTIFAQYHELVRVLYAVSRFFLLLFISFLTMHFKSLVL